MLIERDTSTVLLGGENVVKSQTIDVKSQAEEDQEKLLERHNQMRKARLDELIRMEAHRQNLRLGHSVYPSGMKSLYNSSFKDPTTVRRKMRELMKGRSLAQDQFP